MRHSTSQWPRRSAAAAALSALLLGLTAAPAHADSVRSRQWHLDSMHAQDMWRTSTGRGVTVALIDSGVDGSLTDLKGQVLDGKDYSGQRGDEHTDIAGHGTDMAALIAATGARGSLDGSYGLAPGAKILPIRMRYAAEDDGGFDNKAEFSRVLSTAIRYAADSDAQIINMSLGTANAPGSQNVETPELKSAVKYALSRGKLLFAAVGNNGDRSNVTQYPAATPGVVGVGAADEKAKTAPFSQSGPQVDLVAPGVDMVHACTGGSQICRTRGTSDASAIASASAALIWSKHPDWTNNQVLRVMLNTASKPAGGEKRSDFVGYGGVRPRVALADPGDPGPADEYPLPDLAASTSASPTAAEPTRSAAAEPDQAGPSGTASHASGEDGTVVWLGLGIAAAVLLGGAVVILTRRSRRRSAVTAAPPARPAAPPYPPYRGQDPHHHPPQAPYQPPGGPGQST
ncbi:type VII secretion-associated serine protease mycosin [Streptomyces andamanensis]|uniref:Type VII secretion-associated serine protease mycosin n=1 Tax=Streptomyces andamanensis TaxID=1565035 RepID=A0ABV8TEC5_9ACTN